MKTELDVGERTAGHTGKYSLILFQFEFLQNQHRGDLSPNLSTSGLRRTVETFPGPAQSLRESGWVEWRRPLAAPLAARGPLGLSLWLCENADFKSRCLPMAKSAFCHCESWGETNHRDLSPEMYLRTGNLQNSELENQRQVITIRMVITAATDKATSSRFMPSFNIYGMWLAHSSRATSKDLRMTCR